MKAALPVIILAAGAMLAACVPAARAPAPVQAPAPASVARRFEPPMPASLPDAGLPLAPNARMLAQPAISGAWDYRGQGASSVATFRASEGQVVITLACEGGSGGGRVVTLSRSPGRDMARSITIWAETAVRNMPALPGPAGPTVRFDADNPLLDAMALSKGRIAISGETLEGRPSVLVLPVWTEISRVIEDCRS